LERRRRLAVQRVANGYTTTEVAEFLDVSARVVRMWVASARRGRYRLAARPASGRPPKLDARRTAQVLGWLKRSPTAFGFPNELWTASRVAQVIRRRWGVSFHPRYLSAWLRDRGVTPPKPQRVPPRA
jgi:transposase